MPGFNEKTRESEILAYRVYEAKKPKGLTPARTYTNSAAVGLYEGNKMVCSRSGAGLKSPNGRPA